MSELSIATLVPGPAFAFIVGISKYSDSRIPTLNYTHADAKAFHDLLIDPKRAGFPRENVRLLLDEQATLFNFKHAISGWLFKHATPDSTVIVYFAGHGATEDDKTGAESDGLAKYLLPWDANHENLFASALSNTEFHRLLSTVRARRLVIFLDACYAGGVTQHGARDIGILKDPFEQLSQGEGRVVIASAKPNQRSWEDRDLGHGIFTHHLLEALKGKADLDKDGYISIWEVYKYLEREVPQSARRLATAIQEPFLWGNFSRDIYLTADTERIALLKAQRDEVERENNEAIRAKRRRLFELHDSGELPSVVYQEALTLIEKPTADMSIKEGKLVRNLEALIRNGIAPSDYLDNREAILSQSDRESSEHSLSHSFPQETASHIQASVKTELKYCIHCGTRIIPQNIFCVGCGQRIL